MRDYYFSTIEKITLAIIGIITILTIVFTLKPIKIMNGANIAQGIVDDLDKATSNIILNNSLNGTFKSLYKLDSTDIFDASKGDSESLGKLYKKYLQATDKPCENKNACTCAGYGYSFILQNGTCVGVTAGKLDNLETIFPGEKNPTPSKTDYGVIFFDTNSSKEPNILGKDQFIIPLAPDGIEYTQ